MPKYTPHAALIAIGFLAILSGYLGWQLWQADTKAATERQLFENYLERSSQELAFKQATVDDLASKLELTEEELIDTEASLLNEKERNDAMEEQVTELAGTVSDLDKLSKTDKELLQKYSKVYFLNEHYVPEQLAEIEDEWKYDESREHKLHAKVIPFFDDMLEAAKADGIELWVVSAYRSFYDQAVLKGRYLVTYGAGANAFSADQGFSEHQLGTTVDFTTRGLGGGLSGFDNTEAYEWLLDNAHRYGFTLSYPEGNAFYEYEPWHWRFVGEDLADDLHDASASIYDWEQRDIDQYLLNIFD